VTGPLSDKVAAAVLVSSEADDVARRCVDVGGGNWPS
jgi:hypothetical protein